MTDRAPLVEDDARGIPDEERLEPGEVVSARTIRTTTLIKGYGRSSVLLSRGAPAIRVERGTTTLRDLTIDGEGTEPAVTVRSGARLVLDNVDVRGRIRWADHESPWTLPPELWLSMTTGADTWGLGLISAPPITSTQIGSPEITCLVGPGAAQWRQVVLVVSRDGAILPSTLMLHGEGLTGVLLVATRMDTGELEATRMSRLVAEAAIGADPVLIAAISGLVSDLPLDIATREILRRVQDRPREQVITAPPGVVFLPQIVFDETGGAVDSEPAHVNPPPGDAKSIEPTVAALVAPLASVETVTEVAHNDAEAARAWSQVRAGLLVADPDMRDQLLGAFRRWGRALRARGPDGSRLP